MSGDVRTCQDVSGEVVVVQHWPGVWCLHGPGAHCQWAASNRGTAVTMRCQLSPPLSLSPSRTQFKFSLRDGDNTPAPDIISTLYQIMQTTDSGVILAPSFKSKCPLSIVHILEIQTYSATNHGKLLDRLKECKIERV